MNMMYWILEADLAFRIPGNLKRCCRYRLFAWQVDRSLVLLEREVAFQFEVATDALHDLKIDIVQSGATRNEILRRFLVSTSALNPLIARSNDRSAKLAHLWLHDQPSHRRSAMVGISLPLLILSQ
jgi:hypothetical protein